MRVIGFVALIVALWSSLDDFVVHADDASTQLIFDRKIGEDWTPDQNKWMSFVAISSDGSTVAGDGNVPNAQDGALGLWTFPGGEFIRSGATRLLAISADFMYIATESGVLALKTGESVIRPSRAGRMYAHAAFSQDGEHVALVHSADAHKGERGQITVIKVSDGATVARFGKRHTASIAFHPAGQVVASGHWNNVTLWDSRDGSRLAVLFHGGPHTTGAGLNRDGRYIYGVGFSRDGRLLAAGSDDGELQVWNVETRTLLHSINIGGGDVSTPAFSPDGRLVAAGTYGDGTVTLVDVFSGKILSQAKVSMFGCGSVAFSPDGRFLVTPSNGGQIGPRRFDRGGTIRVFRVGN